MAYKLRYGESRRTKDTARKDERRENDDKYARVYTGVRCVCAQRVGVVNGEWVGRSSPAAKGLKMYRNQVNCWQDAKKVKPLENMAEEESAS